MRLYLLFAGLLIVSSCGTVEWPPTGGPFSRGPQDTNTPRPQAPPATAPAMVSAAGTAFTAATAVVAGRGDTVYALSRRHRVPVRAIIQANHLSPPYHLKTGQRVALPRGRQHTVTRGETFFGVANQYGANPYAMARANGLEPPYDIPVGQVLVLPGSTAAKPLPQKDAKVAVIKRLPRQPPPPAVPQPPAVSGNGFAWPVQGKVVSGFGFKAKGLRNDGINISAARGTPVKATENGVVVYAGNELRGFGNLLLIKHANGWVSAYAHNDTLSAKRGDKVAKGQQVATVGSTGSVNNPQLHFEMRRGRTAQDPIKYLRGV
ncbi:MAG: M23 family metallopeptidase [Proteobacteria bacterium]|nr:M23 family metallopeptidase [Pseudomonadota bacterium]